MTPASKTRETMSRVLLFPVRILWKIFSRIASAVILPVSAVAWALRLTPWFAKIARAEVVILMTTPTGFGHSVIGPDAMRRLYPGKRCLFFTASWMYEHNHKVSLLWEDLDMAFITRLITAIPYRHRVIAIPFLRWHDTMVIWLTRKLVALIGGGRVKFQTLQEMYRDMQALADSPLSPEETAEVEQGEKVCGAKGLCKKILSAVDVTSQLQLLQRRVPMPPLRLPEDIRAGFAPKLRQLWHRAGHDEEAKICCMYLRFEKRESYTTRLRNGSSLQQHLPAIRLLGEAGYQVLLTGDFEIDDTTRKAFEGVFVDDRDMDADRDLYQLFAASEADIFIGNHGGGETLAVVNAIPSLYLNWFPYSHGRKNAWVYFKSACDEEGRLFPGRRLITDFVRDTAASFGTLINNTEEEIADAVASFIEDVAEPDAPDPYADIAALIPQDSQFHLTGARISPAWVRRNIQDITD